MCYLRGTLINSNHATIVSFIKNKTLFRGEWYFSNLPFYVTDVPLMSNWCSKEAKDLITEIIDNSHIKKAIFVYNSNKEFIKKFVLFIYEEGRCNTCSKRIKY